MPGITVREVWWAFVVAGVRSKFGATVLAVMLGVGIWKVATGGTISGVAILAITVLIYARIPAAIGVAIEVRNQRGRI